MNLLWLCEPSVVLLETLMWHVFEGGGGISVESIVFILQSEVHDKTLCPSDKNLKVICF